MFRHYIGHHQVALNLSSNYTICVWCILGRIEISFTILVAWTYTLWKWLQWHVIISLLIEISVTTSIKCKFMPLTFVNEIGSSQNTPHIFCSYLIGWVQPDDGQYNGRNMQLIFNVPLIVNIVVFCQRGACQQRERHSKFLSYLTGARYVHPRWRGRCQSCNQDPATRCSNRWSLTTGC